MNKKDIIAIVNEIGNNPRFSKILDDESKGKNSNRDKIGISQFGSLSSTCKLADCVDEIRLLLEYKTAKGNGWNEAFNNKKFGEFINSKIMEIASDTEGNEEEKLKAISQFFGYLYWKAKVVVPKK